MGGLFYLILIFQVVVFIHQGANGRFNQRGENQEIEDWTQSPIIFSAKPYKIITHNSENKESYRAGTRATKLTATAQHVINDHCSISLNQRANAYAIIKPK